jgi:hypothetical protein
VGSELLERTAIIALIGGAALATYLGVAMLLKTEELNSATTLLGRRKRTSSEAKS